MRNLLLHMPKSVSERLQAAYIVWGWEKSFMSEDLLRQAFWKCGHKFKAAGQWQQVYECSEASLLRFVNKLTADWQAQWSAPGSLATAAQRDVDTNKPMKTKDSDPDFQDISKAHILALMALFLEHWVIPQTRQHFGETGAKQVEDPGPTEIAAHHYI